MNTPKPQEGIWTLTAPDGRTWQGDAPIRCVAAESRERIPATVALQRIFDAASEDHDWLPIDSAPKDGTRVILSWGGKSINGFYLDNSHTSHPWAGWRVESLVVQPAGKPTHWQPFPPPYGVDAVVTRHCTAHSDEIPPMGETVLSPLFDAAPGVKEAPATDQHGTAAATMPKTAEEVAWLKPCSLGACQQPEVCGKRGSCAERGGRQ